MDGDQAPLTELAAVADHHDGFLVIDEAHATGIFGTGGRGLAAGLEGRKRAGLAYLRQGAWHVGCIACYVKSIGRLSR